MSRRPRLVGLAIAALAAVGALSVPAVRAGAAPSAPVRHARIAESAPPRPLVPEATRAAVGWATALGAIDVEMRNTGARAKIRLYHDDGSVDPQAERAFLDVCESKLPERLVQLVFRAAYHFGGKPVAVISANRPGASGKHGTGEAIDFQIKGVRASRLAAYLRRLPRAGVGIYTHPKTQYVHLDVRDRSFHWLDGSPPGVKWRERRIGDPKQEIRDASWRPEMDLPEH